jgi:hypothetical protein
VKLGSRGTWLQIQGAGSAVAIAACLFFDHFDVFRSKADDIDKAVLYIAICVEYASHRGVFCDGGREKAVYRGRPGGIIATSLRLDMPLQDRRFD